MKILLIKLGALGDVIRTLPLAKALKEKYPSSELHWVTKKEAAPIFEENPYVDKLQTLPYTSKESFDLLYNFDIDEEATSLAAQVQAEKRFGFYSSDGFPAAYNLGAEEYLNTLFDDETKKKNRKTYQELMVAAAELPYNKEHVPIFLSEEEKNYAKEFFAKHKIPTEKLIGIHIGASSRWPSKVWAEPQLIEFIKLAKSRGYNILLLGGPNEAARHAQLSEALKAQGISIHRNDPQNSIREFAALVDCCSIMVCSDSFSLHVALALKKPTVGLFFCTSPWEVESYDLLQKAISPMLEEFFPERQDEYSEELTASISAADVLTLVQQINDRK